MRRWTRPACLLLLLSARTQARADGGALNLEEALAAARDRAPAILVARARVEETRGRLRAADVPLRDNPVLDAEAGPREGSSTRTTDINVSLGQTFELGGRRSARVEGSRADLERETAAAEETVRRTLRDTAAIFLQALAAQERVSIDEDAASGADALLRSAERRYAAGDIAALEVNVARAAAARAKASIRAAEAERLEALGALRAILGMPAEEPLEVAGKLGDHGACGESAPAPRLEERGDLKAISADLRSAEADRKWASGLKWPDLSVRIGYEREVEDDVYLVGFGIPLPFFDRGSGLLEEASARTSRLEIERSASRRSADVEVRTALAVCRERVAAAGHLEGTALEALEDNDALAQKSYEAGQIGLGELLLVRRQAIEIRAARLDLLLEASLAAIEYQFAAGVLR